MSQTSHDFPKLDLILSNLKTVMPAGYKTRTVWGGGKDRFRISRNAFNFVEVKINRKTGRISYQSSWYACLVVLALICFPLAIVLYPILKKRMTRHIAEATAFMEEAITAPSK
ncbi:hypothetical protein [Microvirga calopogonii]|uniref:hypothetical protein n=1 Tax=Microvirga calopogonii TaxID=2078013 RepID=UPI000E0DDF14|nr:hypothetical protein [Microvirga calopogonii]